MMRNQRTSAWSGCYFGLFGAHYLKFDLSPVHLCATMLYGCAILQTNQVFYEALAQLTPNQQQVILFKFFEGMDNAQVAKLLGKNRRLC